MAKKYKASDLCVAALENEGVDYVFALPGEENLDLINSLKSSKQIELIVLRHEQGAGFMAANYGRLSGKAGVCLVTLGPGATNIMTAVAYAQLGGMPMIVITGQKPVKNPTQGFFQVLDIVNMMKPITKKAVQIASIDTMAPIIRSAFSLAQADRPGAVHLELPEDIAREEGVADLFPIEEYSPAVPSSISIKKAVEWLDAALSPLILIGMDAKKSGIEESLDEFISNTKLLFVTTQMGKGAINENRVEFLGTTALSDGEKVHEAVAMADYLLAIGHNTIEKPAFLNRANNSKLLHLNSTFTQTTKHYAPDLTIIGDIKIGLELLQKEINLKKTGSKWSLSSFDRYRKGEADNQFVSNPKAEAPFTIEEVIKVVEKIFSNKKSILSLDNGLYKLKFAAKYVAKHPHHLILDNALATMGAGIAGAMTAKLLYVDSKVCAICGDGGFMMNAQELESAIRLGLDLVILILRDDAYGMIRWKQKKIRFEDFGTSFSNPDFVQYAKAHGASGYLADKLSSLERYLGEVVETPGVHLIDVPIRYD